MMHGMHSMALIYLLCSFLICNALENVPYDISNYQAIIDRVQSDEFIDQQIKNGELFAQKYLEPEFIDAIVNADKIQEEKQEKLNQTLVADVSPTIAGHAIPLGIYYGDLFKTAHAGTAWCIEWFLYTTLNTFVVDLYTEKLINSELDSSELSSSWKHIPTLNKKIFASLFTYGLLSIELAHINTRYLLNSYSTRKKSLPGLWSIIPSTFAIRGPLLPASSITMINSFFNTMGLLPGWHDHLHWSISKELCALLLWYRWYDYTIHHTFQLCLQDPDHQIHTILSVLAEKKGALKEHQEIKKLIQMFVKTVIHVPFTTWATQKIIHLSFWHGVANILVATPAWYRLGTWAYDTYTTIMIQPEVQP